MATQLAVLIAKIARYDCPRSWPELVPTLLEAVRVEDQLCQQRALLTFYHVTKVLASKRLMHDRKLFEEVRKLFYFSFQPDGEFNRIYYVVTLRTCIYNDLLRCKCLKIDLSSLLKLVFLIHVMEIVQYVYLHFLMLNL